MHTSIIAIFTVLYKSGTQFIFTFKKEYKSNLLVNISRLSIIGIIIKVSKAKDVVTTSWALLFSPIDK